MSDAQVIADAVNSLAKAVYYGFLGLSIVIVGLVIAIIGTRSSR